MSEVTHRDFMKGLRDVADDLNQLREWVGKNGSEGVDREAIVRDLMDTLFDAMVECGVPDETDFPNG